MLNSHQLKHLACSILLSLLFAGLCGAIADSPYPCVLSSHAAFEYPAGNVQCNEDVRAIFREHPGFFQLLLTDNGNNAVIKDNPGGIGLKNMEDRAASVGGRITFTPSPQGFRIFLTVPMVAGVGAKIKCARHLTTA